MLAPLLALLPTAAPAAFPRAAEAAFVELSAEPRQCYAGEVVRLRLRFGLERGLIEERLVPLFARPLDLPVSVEAGWAQALPGSVRLPEPRRRGLSRSPDLHTFALDGEPAVAQRVDDEERGGLTFAVFELESRWRIGAGRERIAAPRLRFATATRFERDFTGAPLALDRVEETVTGLALEVEGRPLPEEGRPPDFSGAVGSFALAASVQPRQLAAGEELVLRLTITGTGDLGAVEPPRLDRLEGFDLLGSLVRDAPDRRTAIYHLAPRHDGVDAVPALRLPYFDPGPPPAWRAAVTPPIPISVRPAAPDAGEPVPGRATGPPDGGSRRWRAAPAAALVALALAALGAHRVARARRKADGRRQA